MEKVKELKMEAGRQQGSEMGYDGMVVVRKKEAKLDLANRRRRRTHLGSHDLDLSRDLNATAATRWCLLPRNARTPSG